MGAAIALRGDFDAADLRRLAKRSRDGAQSRRLLALAMIYDGHRRSDAARFAGVGLQIVRDWVLRFNAEGAEGLVNRKAPGPAYKLSEEQRAALAAVVESGPDPSIHGVVRWRRCDLAAWLRDRFDVSLGVTTVGQELRRMSYAKRSARPRHYGPGRSRIGGVQKNFPARLKEIRAELGDGVEVEVWWQDEARVGQKNKITRRWAKRGTRPSAPKDQRTVSAYIFGAICPMKGKAAGLVMPHANTEALNAHLEEIALIVEPGAHALVMLDRAGWHMSSALKVPDNITLMPLPPRSPELNPVENVWQFMRDNWLSNRVFKSYDDILDHCCHAWNNLVSQPARIASIGTRKWAHGF